MKGFRISARHPELLEHSPGVQRPQVFQVDDQGKQVEARRRVVDSGPGKETLATLAAFRNDALPTGS